MERSWGAATDDPEFWNPKVRAPICFNPAAARTFVPIFLMKTKLVLAGKSKAEILAATASALDKKELPALEPGAMCYMMSKQQYLNDDGMSWHPHLMFFVPGDAAKSWGANLPGSPVIAADDPEERVTIFMVWAANGPMGRRLRRLGTDSNSIVEEFSGGSVMLASALPSLIPTRVIPPAVNLRIRASPKGSHQLWSTSDKSPTHSIIADYRSSPGFRGSGRLTGKPEVTPGQKS